jgi:glycosyltransferase involved in cell wall biosynthesis
MHRVRQSLPYFEEFGWIPVVITVHQEYLETYSIDPLLSYSIPDDVEVHCVKAFEASKTRKFGIGSLSMRSFFQIRKKGDELLQNNKFDLVYFSTTAFHVMALGPRWKRKYNVPFILDIQDPWRSDFYLDKPKSERPPKFLISYNIDKFLEAKTVPEADGIISVSQGYCDTFLQRYRGLAKDKFRVIPFGASTLDYEIMQKYVTQVERVKLDKNKINLIYVGRGGYDMGFAINIIFKSIVRLKEDNPILFSKIHLWFIGTSYAPASQGKQTIKPLSNAYGISENVTEITDRIPYFETLFLLRKADILLVPGSTDTSYTASKIFPYVLARRPLIALFHEKSSVVTFLKNMSYGEVVVFNNELNAIDEIVDVFYEKLRKLLVATKEIDIQMEKLTPYTAKTRTAQQVEFFDVITSSVLR